MALRATLRQLAVIGAFSLPSVVIFWHLWDGHLASAATCACSDAGQQIWFVAWPAYALAHGLNPFFSSALWAPQGANLLTNASSPLVGLVLAPVTWVWGPVVSTNLALTLAPGLSAWACWIACRQLVAWRGAALVGGLLFGYSPFVFSNIRQGHLGLGVLLVPPLVLVLLNAVVSTQRGPPWQAGVALGLLAAVQFLISPEVLVMGFVVCVIGVVIAAVLAAGSWLYERVRYAVKGLAFAATLGVALLAVPAWYVLAGPRHISGPVWPGLDLFGNSLGDVWDVRSLAPAAHSAPVASAGAGPALLGLTGPNPAFLGAGVLALAVLAVVLTRHRRTTWVLACAGVASFVLSLGSAVFRHDALTSVSWLPWQTLVKWPLLDDVLPGRFAVYTDLAVCVLIALGLDEARRWLADHRRAVSVRGGANWSMRTGPGARRRRLERIAPPALLCLASLIAFVPVWVQYPVPTATEAVDLPPWFKTAALEVPVGSVVLTYPFTASASLASQPMVWQAVDDMRFRLAGGYVKVPGAEGHPLEAGSPGSAVNSLVGLTLSDETPSRSWAPTPEDLASLRGALERWGVSYVVVTATGPSPLYTAAVMTAVIGRPPEVSQRAWVWDLSREPLARSFNAAAASNAFATCRSTKRPRGLVTSL